MLFGIVFSCLCLVSAEGHFGMLKHLFVCGGNHELCDQCCHRFGILVKSCILAVLFVLAVRSVGFHGVSRRLRSVLKNGKRIDFQFSPQDFQGKNEIHFLVELRHFTNKCASSH